MGHPADDLKGTDLGTFLEQLQESFDCARRFATLFGVLRSR